MKFFKWSKKLLVRNEFLTDEEKRRGITKKFAVAEACCCPQWYCVLTAGGDYECRDTRPAPDENSQVLSEHKDETACQQECYERYYCVNVNNEYECKREGDIQADDDVVGGPYPKEECEVECVNCPPCGNDACEAEAAGDNDIIAQCCASLADDEEWTYDEDAAEWTITRHCGDNKFTPCRGDDAAGFPDSPQDGEKVNFPCVPNGKVPDDLPDCKKCLFDCDKEATPPACIPAPDDGKYAKKECEKECAGLWYCTSTTECERQNPPKNPAKKGFETEDECVAAAPEECALSCECFPPPTISSLTVAVRTLEGETEPSLCVEVVGDWSPPDGCYVDSDDSRSKAGIALKFFNDEGEEVASIGGPATMGELLGGYCTPLKVACDPANESQKVASAVAVVTDKSGLCPPATSEKKDMADGAYESACPPPCPDGKFCFWLPPDPCATGKCFSTAYDDPIECPDGFPYDCTSEEACNQWYAANPNPPCDCWFCEDGEWVNKPSLDCQNEGGIVGQQPPPEDCQPPPPPCEDITCTAWEPSTDADGKDCCKRQCCKAELRPDVNGDLNCFCIEDQYEEISYDLTLCGGEPPPPCEGQKRCNDWQADYDDAGNFLHCSRVCCTLDAECACNADGLLPEFSQDQSLCIATPPNPCTGFGRYIWTGTRWELDTTTCSPSADCRPAPPPTQPGSFVDELVQVDCQPIARNEPNPLP